MSKKVDDICFGFGHVLYASLLEGKRVPTFPMKACRRRKAHKYKVFTGGEIELMALSGLQLSGTLATALELIRKYGLDSQRQKHSPVQVAVESLLSKSTLKIAGAPDMDLESAIDYCLDESLFAFESSDVTKLRFKMGKCLAWAEDPARPPVATTVQEAAAIMLYTQQTCIYPRLNSALRDHINPEKLAPFLPYLKLLLKGLNKLPLMRARVYRGVTLDLHDQYNQLQGQVFTWWAFSSSTMRNDLMHTPTFLGSSGDRTLFRIDAIGVDISPFSAHPGEQEVVLLPGTPVMVEPGVNVEDGYWKFETSVWEAAQHERRKQVKERRRRSFEKLLDAMIEQNKGVAKLRFQNTDLPHPGWEEIVCLDDEGNISSQTLPDKRSEFSSLPSHEGSSTR